VDGDPVPVPHFGLALGVDQFHDLAKRVQDAGIKFILEPHIRFQGAQWPESFAQVPLSLQIVNAVNIYA